MSASIAETPSIDLRPLPRPQRHVLVFRHFEALAPGEAFELVNDHDPLGLLHQFHELLSGQFTWDYRKQGPEEWRVVLGRTETAVAAPHVHDAGCGCGSSGGGGN
ncbi:DUF2249 domain-containing protein [Stappia sp. F7233]|uniref:DUF2249 domain-containing protein n=1 Tax=Stappia albiluteola TaxID=2758565 RepID=A0A839A906_9HYPH|nr:DUF2249 domain-containing protein [Stappia albiluteola]MBA5775696.1 DUF2249 domain-containing protein [Stappia albiluteola]